MPNTIEFQDGLTLSFNVSDMDNAIDWYQRVLGFELDYRMDEVGWCELKTPLDQVTVGLSVVEELKPGGATPTFGVRDIEAAKASLETNDVRIDGDIITIPGMVKYLTFYDIDGNSLMFFQTVSSDD